MIETTGVLHGRRAGPALALAALLGLALGCSAEPGGTDAGGGEQAAQKAETTETGEKADREGTGAAGDTRPAPDFTLKSLEGEEVSLESLRGRTVLVDFWATWCAPCVFQIPLLNDFYAEHKDEGVEVLGVSIDADGEEAIRPFMEETPIHYPVLLGDEGLARRFGAPGFPALFVINPEGQIVYLHVGLAEEKELEEVLQKIRGSDGSA